MTPEQKQQKLNENYRLFLEAKAKMDAEGKAIGTFSAWQFENKLVDIRIPLTREEHFGKGG